MVKCLVVGMLIILSISSFAQTSELFCGTDAIYQNNPVLKQELINKTLALRNARVGAVDPNTVFTIPVVFVVYHLGEAVGTGSNLSDAKLNDELAKLNDAFRARGTFAGLNDSKIQFERAKFDANCGAASGIVRVNASSVAGYAANGLDYGDNTTHQALRTLHNWNNRDEYITIELVHKLNGASGYAGYLSGYLVIDAQAYWYGLTAHEMGHCLNLFHTFQGDKDSNGESQCPPNTDPETQGDLISDTDPHKNNDFCLNENGSETSINGCSGVPFGKLLRNFMSYNGPCWDRFTPKQIERMRNSVATFKPKWINSRALTGLITPPIANAVERCGPGTVTLTASACAGTYNWYATNSGGSSLGTDATFNTPAISATTIYYVNCTEVGCSTSPRTPVQAIILNTLEIGCYCNSMATGTGDGDIINVTVGSLNNTSTCTTTGTTGSILNRYSNFTHLSPVSFTKGSTVPYSIQIGTCGGNYANAVKVFIDYNRNGSFDDVGENVIVSTSTIIGPHTITGTLTIPVSAVSGLTFMRVINVETSPSNITSCGNYGYGETEDYRINITDCTPPIPPITTGNSRCGAGTVMLSASGCAGTYNWYDVSSGGNSLGTASSYTTPSISTTTPYYVSCTVGNCTSTRASAVATINNVPSAPTIAPVTINSGQTATLTASNCNTGTVKWYDASTGGNLLFSGNPYMTSVLTNNTTFYATCTISSCESATRGSGTVTVNPVNNPCPPTITHGTGVLPAGTYQAGQTITSQANISSPTTYKAGQSILLTNGFQAGPNETFLAMIGGCNTNTIPTNGLVLHLPFNNNANDASGNNFNGTASGSVTYTARGTGQSLNVAANTGQYITVPNNATLQNLSSMTLSAWVKPTAFNLGCYTEREMVVGKGKDVSANAFGMSITRNTTPSCGSASSFTTYKMSFEMNGSSIFSDTYSVDNQWKHVICTYDGTSQKLYINGLLVQQQNIGAVNTSNTLPLYVNYATWSGGAFNSNGRFGGGIDEIRIYNRTLTDAEVLQIYNAEKL